MKRYILHITITLMTALFPVSILLANVYVVIYATDKGRTGHSGIAIDNYQQRSSSNKWDTVKTGSLTYFDLWPAQDKFRLGEYAANCEARFYKLPDQFWPDAITVSTLYDRGIPHKEFYPSDAILMLRTNPLEDYRLMRYLDSMIRAKRFFNPRSFNCSDFVCGALKQVLPGKVHAREFLPFSFCTTPNKLCRKLMKRTNIVVLKDPGKVVRQPFLWARIVKRKAPHLK